MAAKTVRSKAPSPAASILEQQVFLELTKTQDEKMAQLSALLKEHGLSEPQYNVLRILRGAGEEGLPCQQIAERMLTRLPDITRLVDRLVDRDYVHRERGAADDRRRVIIQIRPSGLALLAQLDEPVTRLHRAQFSSLKRGDLQELERLLIKARSGD